MTDSTATPDANTVEATGPLTDSKEVTYRFKKDDLGNKRADVKVTLQVPNFDGIVEILNTSAEEGGKKAYELLQEAIMSTITAQGRDLVNGDEAITGDANFPHEKALWNFIANMSKEDRRSSSIPEEQWKAFAADYISVMPSVTGKTVDQVTNATVVYLKKFSVVKTDKVTLQKLKPQLALYIEHSKNAEQFSDILELLDKRLDTYLAADDVTVLTSNL